MTQEQKAKAYDEAIERAKAMIKVAANQDETIGFANTIFPELKEWEDERAMKDLLNFLKSPFIKDNICDWKVAPWIAWIEKHGQVKESVIFQHENKTCKENDDSLTNEDEKIRDEICIYIGAKQDISLDVHNRWLSWLERQGKKLPVGFYYVNSEGKKFYSDTFKYGDVTLRVEKQDEQKSTDKVEPKFKPGDWVVYYRNGQSREVLQIYDIRDDRYYFTDNVHFSWSVKECDEKSHLWTIKDAKPGDILFHSDSASNGIFIFKELLKYEFSEKVICYCDYDSEDHFCLGEHHTCCWTDAKILHPATKEQCDILFQKMKEAGYEWDANKKQLKKNEQKLAEEKESLLKDLEWVDMETNECHCYNCELFDGENNVCKCIDLCKRPKNTYKGFYKVMKTERK